MALTPFRRFGTVMGLAALAACEDSITVPNQNQPDVARAFATPAGIQQVLSTSYQQLHEGLYASTDAISPQGQVMAFESYGSVANFGMAIRGGLPRVPIDNGRGNAVFLGNFRDFSQAQRVMRNAADGVRALDALLARGGTLGSPGADNIGADQRARAFGFFVNGLSLGYASIVYDSAAIVTPAVPSDVVPTLSGYRDVSTAALALLDSAVAIANAVPTASVTGFTLPAAWVRNNALTRDQFVAVVRSYRARFRAGVARDTLERRNVAAGGIVDWARVRDDAVAGIAADLNINLDLASGWRNTWLNQMMEYQGWHQMTPFMIGMADTSGTYLAWLNVGIANKTAPIIRTPDRRFPQGDTRTAQNAAYNTEGTAAPPAGLYFGNRPEGRDLLAAPWGNSQYDHVRFRGYRLQAQANFNWPAMTTAEVRLLAAEAHIRLGNAAAAIPLINVSRTAAGLPAIPTAAAATDPVPGGSACVPRTPVPSGSTYTTPCATLLEAMKYEKRIETAHTGYIQWFIDSRGWGDLPQGTATEWPVPYQEMDARARPFYGSTRAAGRGTYAF